MTDEDAADAFALLGSDVRLGVLRALAMAELDHGDDPGPYDVRFSTLYDAVAVDSSSAFAYHLEKLEGIFIEQTDDGYRLTDRGQRVVRAILAGTYTDRAAFGPVDLDGHCPVCGATTLRATNEADKLVVACVECGTALVTEELPASQVTDRSTEAVLDSIAVRVRADLEQAVDGVCGSCGGPIEATVEAIDIAGRTRWLFRGDCPACHRRVNAPVEWCLFAHPAVAGFYWDHGIVLRDEPIWQAFRRLEGDEWTLDRTDDGFQCVVRLDDDRLELAVASDLSVRDAQLLNAR